VGIAALGGLVLNSVIRRSSPILVRQPSTQVSSVRSGTWLCTNTVHLRVQPAANSWAAATGPLPQAGRSAAR
jgi:hypothetical protein